MLISKSVFEIFITTDDKSFNNISSVIKERLGQSLMVYEYAYLLGLITLAEELKVTPLELYDAAYLRSVDSIKSFPKFSLSTEQVIATSGSCGSCGGGQVR